VQHAAVIVSGRAYDRRFGLLRCTCISIVCLALFSGAVHLFATQTGLAMVTMNMEKQTYSMVEQDEIPALIKALIKNDMGHRPIM